MEEKIIQVEAVKENLLEVLGSVEEYYEEVGCPIKTQMQINIAVEEIFVNIASYAYPDREGKAEIILEKNKDTIALTFRDSGIPFDPLKKTDPDTALSAEEREIGGLGIFLVKKNMDDVRYTYQDGYNTLRMTKKLR